MEWEPEQQDLGGLGFTGICREIYRVAPGAIILPNSEAVPAAAFLSASLLAHVTACSAIVSGLVTGDGVRFVLSLAALILSEPAFICVIHVLSSACTAVGVFRVGSLYCTDGDPDATDRILRDIPRAPLDRLVRMFPLAMSYTVFSAMVSALLVQLHRSHEVVDLPLQVIGGAVCLASAAYVSVVSHVACVVAMLDGAVFVGAVRKSRALLAGKLWQAAAVFVPLDVCCVASQIFFPVLVLDDALGLGLWFKVAAVVAMAVVLWAVVVVMLVAQPVVYLVCKNHHHEVVDKVHLNYVGEYQQLVVVDGDNGAVELQSVDTAAQIPATSGLELQSSVNTPQIPATSECPGQSPAASSPTT